MHVAIKEGATFKCCKNVIRVQDSFVNKTENSSSSRLMHNTSHHMLLRMYHPPQAVHGQRFSKLSFLNESGFHPKKLIGSLVSSVQLNGILRCSNREGYIVQLWIMFSSLCRLVIIFNKETNLWAETNFVFKMAMMPFSSFLVKSCSFYFQCHPGSQNDWAQSWQPKSNMPGWQSPWWTMHQNWSQYSGMIRGANTGT